MRAWLTGIGMGIVLVTCGGNNGSTGHVELSGQTPTEAAAIAARSVCNHDARCGRVRITCSGSGSAGGSGIDASPPTSSCVATIDPVVYEECYADANADIAALLTCAAFTAEQINTLEICFDMLAARNCVPQAEADAQARTIEAGGSQPPDGFPAACTLLITPPPGC
jgi:hypothetical protein